MSKSDIFRALHKPGQPFILANAWDCGSARMLQAMGAQAIGTSSAAHAFTLGRADMGHVTRDEALRHAADLVAAVDLPVQGDFENGFGDTPDECAETTRLASEVGLAGLCIEDTALPGTAPYDFELAVDRIRAAAEVAQKTGIVLTARADGLMLNTYDVGEATRRLHAYEAAGADCLYAPLPATWDDLNLIIRSVTAPVNVLVAGDYAHRPMGDYAAIGAARLSLGAALARVTHAAILNAGRAMFDQGDFTPLTQAANGDMIDTMITRD